MRLTPKPPEIGDRDGFEGTDIFGYQRFGESVARVVESLEGPSVIALDGEWGSGKTVFARQWAGLLRKRGSAVVYFDAFSADNGEDPLFDIASQIFDRAPNGEERKVFLRKVTSLGKHLLPSLAGLGLRIVTGGILSEETGQKLVDGLSKVKRDPSVDLDSEFQKRLENAQEQRKTLDEFRQALTALADAMSAEAKESASEGIPKDSPRPLVVIIDELDRCRPTYALSLLENLKHVFDVENICFVLVTNRKQLEQIVTMQYGVQNSKKYLEKFFHAHFRLPVESVTLQNTGTLEAYANFLWKDMLGYKVKMPYTGAVLLGEITSRYGDSLRMVAQLMRDVGVCLRGNRNELDEDIPALCVTLVCALHSHDPELYSKLRAGQVTDEELILALDIEKWRDPDSKKLFREKIELYFSEDPALIKTAEGQHHSTLLSKRNPARQWIRGLCRQLDSMGQ